MPRPGAKSDTIMITDDPPRWQRLLFMVAYAIVAYALLWLGIVLAVVQFVLQLVNGEVNNNLKEFVARLIAYFGAVLAFLSFQNNTVPFPFSPFPPPASGKAPPRRATRKSTAT